MIMGGGIGLILLGLLLWFIISYSNHRQNPFTNQYQPNETSLEILKKRYARGEITKEEFDEMSKNIR